MLPVVTSVWPESTSSQLANSQSQLAELPPLIVQQGWLWSEWVFNCARFSKIRTSSDQINTGALCRVTKIYFGEDINNGQSNSYRLSLET